MGGVFAKEKNSFAGFHCYKILFLKNYHEIYNEFQFCFFVYNSCRISGKKFYTNFLCLFLQQLFVKNNTLTAFRFVESQECLPSCAFEFTERQKTIAKNKIYFKCFIGIIYCKAKINFISLFPY